MGIEPGDSDARRKNAQRPAGLCRKTDCPTLILDSHPGECVPQGDMDRDKDDAQGPIGEHHRDIRRAGFMRKNFSMSGKGHTGGMQCLLVDRRRDKPPDSSLLRQPDSGDDGPMCKCPRLRIDNTIGQICWEMADTEHRHRARRSRIDHAGCWKRDIRQGDLLHPRFRADQSNCAFHLHQIANHKQI